MSKRLPNQGKKDTRKEVIKRIDAQVSEVSKQLKERILQNPHLHRQGGRDNVIVESISVKGACVPEKEMCTFAVEGIFKYQNKQYRATDLIPIRVGDICNGLQKRPSIPLNELAFLEQDGDDNEYIAKRILSKVAVKVPEIISEMYRQVMNNQFTDVEQVMRDNSGRYRGVISAQRFIRQLDQDKERAWKKRFQAALNDYLYKPPNAKYSLNCASIEFTAISDTNIEVRYKIEKRNSYCPSEKIDSSFVITLPSCEDYESLRNAFNRAVQKKIISIVQELWGQNSQYAERYDYKTCLAMSNINPISASVARLIGECLKPCEQKIDGPYVAVVGRRGNEGIAIERMGWNYHITFPVGRDIVLQSDGDSISMQRVPVNPYEKAETMKNKPLPSNIVDLYCFASYLDTAYTEDINEKNLQASSPCIIIEIGKETVNFFVGKYRICLTRAGFSRNRNFPKLDDWTDNNSAYDFAQAIIQQAISVSKEADAICSNRLFTPEEVQILEFVKTSKKAGIFMIKNNVRSDNIAEEGISHLVRKLYIGHFLDSVVTRDAKGALTLYALNPIFQNVDFWEYNKVLYDTSSTSLYNLDDFPYLKPNAQETLLQSILSDEESKEEDVLRAFNLLLQMPQETVERLCKESPIVWRLNDLSDAGATYVEMALQKTTGNGELGKQVFAGKVYSQFENLAAEGTIENTQKIADLIMETNPDIVNGFFETEAGKQYLSSCDKEQREILADALVCVPACHELNAKIVGTTDSKNK